MKFSAECRVQSAKWVLHGSALVVAVFGLVPLWAATNPPTDDAIPALRPPRPFMPPTIWEEHGLALVVVSALLLLLLSFLIWLVTRPKPTPEIVPATQARNELRALQTAPGPQTLSRTSQILRRYFTAVFDLPMEESTTTEFCGLTQDHPAIGSELAGDLRQFLTHCDELKFAPKTPGPAPDTVNRALKLIDQAEARLAASRVPSAPLPVPKAGAS